MLAHGSWIFFHDIEDPELKDLASRLPNTVLHSRVDSTVKKYMGAFKRWKTLALAHCRLQLIPTRSQDFVLYLQYIGEEKASKSAAEEACNALACVHSISG